jgi:ABC-type multidrug transport system fused ATPase/permease subunit
MIRNHLTFRNKTLQEIRWWAWAAAIMPISALAGLFFIWAYGTSNMFNIAMIVGSSTMFVVAVLWWWWALHAIYTLIDHWDETSTNVKAVVSDVKDLKAFVQETFRPAEDK